MPVPPQPKAPFSTLALVSFILSLLGFTAIPGVICSHIALGQIKRQPATRGRGFALAGMILGYASIALTLAVAALLVPALIRAKHQLEARNQPGFQTGSGRYSGPAMPPGSRRLGNGGPSARPQVTPVSTDPLSAKIPATPASGTIHGTAFTAGKATLQNGILTLSKTGEGFGQEEILIFLFPKAGESSSGKKYIVPGGQTMNPHVHVRYREGNGSNVHMVMDGYAMRLEFGQANGSVLPGKIYLELPAEYRTTVSGTFQAQVQ